MITALRAELVLLTRRGILVGGGLATMVLAVLGTAVGFLTEGDGGGPMGGDRAAGTASTGTAALETASGIVDGITNTTGLLAVVTLVIAVLAVANEYSHGTLRNLLIRHPNRPSLLGGKLLGIALAATAAAATATVVAIIAAFGFAAANGVDTAAWTTAAGASAVFEAFGTLTLVNLTAACIGATLAVVTRSPAPALGIGIGWVLLGEQLVGSLASASDWLPIHLAEQVGAGVTAATVAALTAWAALLIGGAMWLFTTRDVDN